MDMDAMLENVSLGDRLELVSTSRARSSQSRSTFPKLGPLMDDARAGVLAFTAFPTNGLGPSGIDRGSAAQIGVTLTCPIPPRMTKTLSFRAAERR